MVKLGIKKNSRTKRGPKWTIFYQTVTTLNFWKPRINFGHQCLFARNQLSNCHLKSNMLRVNPEKNTKLRSILKGCRFESWSWPKSVLEQRRSSTRAVCRKLRLKSITFPCDVRICLHRKQHVRHRIIPRWRNCSNNGPTVKENQPTSNFQLTNFLGL